MRSVFLSIFILLASSCFAQLQQILPKDESKQDPELFNFVKALETATFSRDTNFIYNHTAMYAYIPEEGGERVSKERFLDYYFSGKTIHQENLWESLEAVFAIGGGAFNELDTIKETYYMPYTSAAIYDNEYFTSLGVVLALSARVNVYEQPNTNSNIITTLNYEIINLDETLLNSIPAWEAVRTEKALLGFVRSDEVIYTISNRCGLKKENDLWKLEYSGNYH